MSELYKILQDIEKVGDLESRDNTATEKLAIAHKLTEIKKTIQEQVDRIAVEALEKSWSVENMLDMLKPFKESQAEQYLHTLIKSAPNFNTRIHAAIILENPRTLFSVYIEYIKDGNSLPSDCVIIENFKECTGNPDGTAFVEALKQAQETYSNS